MRIVSYFQDGGPIMYILLLLSIAGVSLILYKFWQYNGEKKQLDQIANEISGHLKNKTQNVDSNGKIELAKQEIQGHIAPLEKGLNTIRMIATVSPLFGLLGTVLGVLMSFRLMSEAGASDPSVFASGISVALITTVGGLAVAIPHYIAHNYLLGTIDDIETRLEKDVLNKIL